jgi:hypothetical protein
MTTSTDAGLSLAAGTGTVSPNVTADSFGDLAITTYCRFLKACEPKLGPSFPTTERCVDQMSLGLSDGFAHPAFWAKNTALYRVDKNQAEACLAKLEAANCSTGLPLWEVKETCNGSSSNTFFGNQLQHLLQSTGACSEALVGTLGQNACCDYRGGCGPGLHCERTNAAAIGTCQPAGADTESCWTRPCQADLVCIKSACTPYVKLGEACVINNVFGTEWVGSNCGAGLYCDESQHPPRCAASNLTAGSPCQCLSCAAGFYCDSRHQPSVCQPYKAEFEPCTNTDKCSAGLSCAQGICRRIGSLLIGEPCQKGSKECAEGIEGVNCVDDSNGVSRCQAPGLLGNACDPQLKSGSCALDHDLVCDSQTRVCRSLPGLGQACQGRCADNINVYCAYADPADSNGICQPRVPLDSTCATKPQSSTPCTSGACEASAVSWDSGCRLDLRCDTTTRTCVARTRAMCP